MHEFIINIVTYFTFIFQLFYNYRISIIYFKLWKERSFLIFINFMQLLLF